MLRSVPPQKKLITPAGPGGPAEGDGGGRQEHPHRGALQASYTWGTGRATLQQLWTSEGSKGYIAHSPQSVSICAGKAVFLPPKQWSRVYLPFKVLAEGGVSLVVALQRVGLLAGLGVTKGGQLRVNIWNSLDETIHLTPKTVMVNVQSGDVLVKHHGEALCKITHIEVYKDLGDRLKEEIMNLFPSVGDLSSHPVNDEMRWLEVRSSEVVWREPLERGSRTQNAVENVADRKLVQE